LRRNFCVPPPDYYRGNTFAACSPGGPLLSSTEESVMALWDAASLDVVAGN